MNSNTCPMRNTCANYYDDNACNLCNQRPGMNPSNYRPMPERGSTNCKSSVCCNGCDSRNLHTPLWETNL